MSKFAKLLFVLCLGFGGLPQAFAQDEAAADQNAIEVQNPDRQRSEATASESPEFNRLVYVTIGEARAPKVVTQQFDFRPVNRNESIYEVRLVGTGAVVDIRAAQVVLRNGQVFSLNRLVGSLREGQRRRVNFGHNGVRIDSIRIWATSPNLFGSRGTFRVDTLVNR